PFCDYEVHPTTAWNYALGIDPERLHESIDVHHRPMAEQPWAHDGSPVFLTAPARRIPAWVLENGSAGAIPAPLGVDPRVERVQLIPYGCARLRIAMFPLV